LDKDEEERLQEEKERLEAERIKVLVTKFKNAA